MPVTLGVIGLGVGAVGTGVNLYNSYQERKAAKEQLEALRNTPMEQYSATPELLNYYGQAVNESNNARGISGGERSVYNANVAGNINTYLTNAKNTSGGNLYKYLSSGISPQIVSGANQLVSQDQSIKRGNRQSALSRTGVGINYLQNISNQNVAAKNRRQELIAQALGGGIAQQNQNIAGGYNNLANAGFYLAGKGLGGGGTPSVDRNYGSRRYGPNSY